MMSRAVRIYFWRSSVRCAPGPLRCWSPLRSTTTSSSGRRFPPSERRSSPCRPRVPWTTRSLSVTWTSHVSVRRWEEVGLMSDGGKVKLLQEWFPLGASVDQLREARTSGDGKIRMRCILQKADTLNQNGRIYPQPILEREVRNYQKFIRERRALGEADHPETSVVELKNVSHLITKMWMDGNVVHGELELLDTPSGKILQTLVESSVTLGISSRGVGSTRRDGERDIVQDDFALIAFDVVGDP